MTEFWCYARSGTITTTPQKWTTYSIPRTGRITTTKLWVPSKCLPAVPEWPKVIPFNANFTMHQKVSGTKGQMHSPVNVVY